MFINIIITNISNNLPFLASNNYYVNSQVFVTVCKFIGCKCSMELS